MARMWSADRMKGRGKSGRAECRQGNERAKKLRKIQVIHLPQRASKSSALAVKFEHAERSFGLEEDEAGMPPRNARKQESPWSIPGFFRRGTSDTRRRSRLIPHP